MVGFKPLGFLFTYSDRPPTEMALLFPGCDYEHWLIVMDKPGGEGANKQQIDCYVETIAKVLERLDICNLSPHKFLVIYFSKFHRITRGWKKEPVCRCSRIRILRCIVSKLMYTAQLLDSKTQKRVITRAPNKLWLLRNYGQCIYLCTCILVVNSDPKRAMASRGSGGRRVQEIMVTSRKMNCDVETERQQGMKNFDGCSNVTSITAGREIFVRDTVRVNIGYDTVSNPKKDYEFYRVYGPHIGQA